LDDSYTPYDVDERVSSILESLEYSSVEITDMVTESPDPAFVQFSGSEEDTESGHIWEFAQVEAFVHNLPILESMPHANRCILATDLVLKEYVDNEELARAGDVGEEMFFLVSPIRICSTIDISFKAFRSDHRARTDTSVSCTLYVYANSKYYKSDKSWKVLSLQKSVQLL
jgi:hypothetical protein